MTESRTGFDTVKLVEQEWEIVRLKPLKMDGSPEEVKSSYFGAFILLRKTHSAWLPYHDEYFIEFIPLVEVGGYGTKELWNSSLTWDVSVELFQDEKKVTFAKHGHFIIKDIELRGRGLGSWIVSDLISWTQKHYMNSPLDSRIRTGV